MQTYKHYTIYSNGTMCDFAFFKIIFMHVGDIVPTGKPFVLAFQATEDLVFSYLRMMR